MTSRPGLAARLALALVRFHQRRVSALVRSRHCRFDPTCSEYAYQAIDRYGLIAGGRMALARLDRCGPEQPVGLDPVP